MSLRKTRQVYHAMLQRCAGKTEYSQKYYVPKGITVCDRWKESFINFLIDMGEQPEGLTLDRINNDLGYFKENCRYVDRKVQNRNTRKNKYILFSGSKNVAPGRYMICQLGELAGIPQQLIRSRIRYWPETVPLDWDKILSNVNYRTGGKVGQY